MFHGPPALSGDLSNDPIAQSLKDRLDFNSSSPAVQVPEADAKKKGYTVPKQIKLLVKGKETQDLLPSTQEPAADTP